MFCQNCRTEVDDDLIFCTNCGARLFEPKPDAQTVLMNESRPTNDGSGKSPKSSSRLKWAALIVALLAIPASIFGVYLLMNSQKRQQVSQNINKPKTPAVSPTRKTDNNQNLNVNVSNTNTASSNWNAAKPVNKTEIMNERIEIAPGEHYAVPFEVTDETAKIKGKVSVLEGEKIDGFVYLQKSFDEHFPDPNYKVFSIEGKKTAETEQTLVKENYVLVFVNDTEKPLVIQGVLSIE